VKIRTGFVSNSSTSSFIISLSAYGNVAEVAVAMIPAREWDERDDELIEKIENMKPDMKEEPIAFASCNYDTYISKEEDGYYIDTCNNHEWDDVLEGIDEYGGGGDYGNEDRVHAARTGNQYYWPERERSATPVSYDELERIQLPSWCTDQHCYGGIGIDPSGNHICIRCGKIYKGVNKHEDTHGIHFEL